MGCFETGSIDNVLLNCKPVSGAEIEIEYMNHEPLPDKNAFAKETKVEAPQDAFVLQAIFADANGIFAFGVPKAGWWGFAALSLDPDYQTPISVKPADPGKNVC